MLLTPGDFLIITEYVKVMTPVAKSLDKMQAEFIGGSQGYIMPVLVSMKHHISSVEESSSITKEFKKYLLEVIHQRFDKYLSFSETNKELILAAVSIPKVKFNFIADNENIIYAKAVLVAECKTIGDNNVGDIDSTPDFNEGSSSTKKQDDFIISFAQQQNIRRGSIENDIESEVSRYLFDDRTESAMLNEYSHVREVYFKYNTTISSSAPVERLFSQSGLIYTPRRNRLSAKRFEQALLLKHNRAIIK